MKTIIITGSSSGIGSYLVDYYLGQGYRVVGCSRKFGDVVPTVWKKDKEINFIDCQLDVTHQASIESFFYSFRTNLKIAPDILINCAGIASMNHFLLTSKLTVIKIMETNFLGTFSMCQSFAKFAKSSARIVNFSSIGVNLNLEGETAYVCSKAAVEQLTKNLAKELAPITVNCISPNLIKTNLLKGFDFELEDKLDKIINLQAIKRFGEFGDVSNVIDFFISSKSDMITGQIIGLGGVL